MSFICLPLSRKTCDNQEITRRWWRGVLKIPVCFCTSPDRKQCSSQLVNTRLLRRVRSNSSKGKEVNSWRALFVLFKGDDNPQPLGNRPSVCFNSTTPASVCSCTKSGTNHLYMYVTSRAFRRGGVRKPFCRIPEALSFRATKTDTAVHRPNPIDTHGVSSVFPTILAQVSWQVFAPKLPSESGHELPLPAS